MQEAKGPNVEDKAVQMITQVEENKKEASVEIKKQLTQQSDTVQKRLAERRKLIEAKRSLDNSQLEIMDTKKENMMSPNVRNVPLTMKGD